MRLEYTFPEEIERRSMEIIESEMGAVEMDPMEKTIVKRVIHTTADFDYLKNMYFSNGAARIGLETLRDGADVITDTNMAKAGINKAALAKLGGKVQCFMSDPEVVDAAKRNGTTRAVAAVEKAARLDKPFIYVCGNAPTALIRLSELINEGALIPALIIAVPVGFVNVVYAKELIMGGTIPNITAKGRKGGSTVAAAIVNALIYRLNEARE